MGYKKIIRFICLGVFIILIDAHKASAQQNKDLKNIICSSTHCNGHPEDVSSANELAEASITVQVQEFFTSLFDTSLWPARWYCGEWSEFHGWFYILSDVGIWAAYFAIPIVLAMFYYRKRSAGLPFPGIFLLFSLFIFACGLTHLIDALIFWVPVYKFSAFIRFITAAVSIATVFALVRITPKVMEYKSPEELEKIIYERTTQLEAVNEELAAANEEFSTINEELSVTNQQLKDEMTQREIAEIESEMLFESIPQLAWIADSEGELIRQNQVFQVEAGIEHIRLEELWKNYIHPEDAPSSMKRWQQSVETGEKYEVQERIKLKEGNYRWFLTRATPVRDNEGQIIKWIGTCTDINEQKASEQRKDTFLNIASHELKTPLTIIGAYSDLALQHENVDKDKTLKNYLTKIDQQVDNLDKLIGELLDVSKIDSGKMEFEYSIENFDEIVRESIKDFQQIKNTDHHISIKGATGKSIKCDRGKIHQVIFNLLSNAAKYSPPDTEINVLLNVNNSNVLCTVEDHGTGIPVNELKNVFSRFYRTEATKSIGGLGLGLYISDKIITRHGGKIEVESTEGVGSKFTIVLPV
ncbi:MAG: ATP-binding protein [Candidatus Cyclobacteriaceae bacterium M2_1C_046]